MKTIRRVDRINTSPRLYGRGVDFCKKYDRLKLTSVVENGRIVKKKVIEAYDTKTLLNAYCATDFALENLVAAGVAGSLNPCAASLNTLDAADLMDNVMFEMSNSNN